MIPEIPVVGFNGKILVWQSGSCCSGSAGSQELFIFSLLCVSSSANSGSAGVTDTPKHTRKWSGYFISRRNSPRSRLVFRISRRDHKIIFTARWTYFVTLTDWKLRKADMFFCLGSCNHNQIIWLINNKNLFTWKHLWSAPDLNMSVSDISQLHETHHTHIYYCILLFPPHSLQMIFWCSHVTEWTYNPSGVSLSTFSLTRSLNMQQLLCYISCKTSIHQCHVVCWCQHVVWIVFTLIDDLIDLTTCPDTHHIWIAAVTGFSAGSIISLSYEK